MGNVESTNFCVDVMPEGVLWGDIPLIRHKPQWVGPTDYLDRIRPADLQYHVSRGTDQFRRKYLIVYYKGNIQTYFQRYTNSPNGTWSFGEFVGGNPDDRVLITCGNIAAQPESIEKIRNVIAELLPNNTISRV